jgi:hypothetical protein
VDKPPEITIIATIAQLNFFMPILYNNKDMSAKVYRRRRSVAALIIGILLAGAVYIQANYFGSAEQPVANIATTTTQQNNSDQPLAIDSLAKLLVKGRAPKTGYSRDQFGNGWASWKSESGKTCDTRQRILGRDLVGVQYDTDGCTVLSGVLHDPYTGKDIDFTRGAETSSAVQIDHVVALSDAWQKGAQNLTAELREQLANDDLELLASDGSANMQKSDGDAATWLPANKSFRCQYVARQIAVKIKYSLWITAAEHDAMAGILANCPNERLPAP